MAHPVAHVNPRARAEPDRAAAGRQYVRLPPPCSGRSRFGRARGVGAAEAVSLAKSGTKKGPRALPTRRPSSVPPPASAARRGRDWGLVRPTDEWLGARTARPMALTERRRTSSQSGQWARSWTAAKELEHPPPPTPNPSSASSASTESSASRASSASTEGTESTPVPAPITRAPRALQERDAPTRTSSRPQPIPPGHPRAAAAARYSPKPARSARAGEMRSGRSRTAEVNARVWNGVASEREPATGIGVRHARRFRPMASRARRSHREEPRALARVGSTARRTTRPGHPPWKSGHRARWNTGSLSILSRRLSQSCRGSGSRPSAAVAMRALGASRGAAAPHDAMGFLHNAQS